MFRPRRLSATGLARSGGGVPSQNGIGLGLRRPEPLHSGMDRPRLPTVATTHATGYVGVLVWCRGLPPPLLKKPAGR